MKKSLVMLSLLRKGQLFVVKFRKSYPKYEFISNRIIYLQVLKNY